MLHLLPAIVALSSLVAASSIQKPIVDDKQELISSSKPIIDSESLQSHIKSDNLLKRAKHLFKIAELGIEEYNHPTRVIGSEGRKSIC